MADGAKQTAAGKAVLSLAGLAVAGIVTIKACADDRPQSETSAAPQVAAIQAQQDRAQAAEQRQRDEARAKELGAGLRPEMWVQLPPGSPVCRSMDTLEKMTGHLLRGEKTKALGMVIGNGGVDCTFSDSAKPVKVLAAHYSDPSSVGVIEIVAWGDTSAEGVFALTANAVEVDPPPDPPQKRKK